jgi:hypothetical protein
MPEILNTYELGFTAAQWEELTSLAFEPFVFSEGDALPRAQWQALAYIALGKAELMDKGSRYGSADEGDGVDPKEWAEELREIAEVILEFFQPGDGKI